MGRMRRPEGLPPKVERKSNIDLGASPSTVFEASLASSIAVMILVFLFFPKFRQTATYTPTGQDLIKFEDRDRKMALLNPSHRILALLKITKLDTVFKIFTSRDEAISYLEGAASA